MKVDLIIGNLEALDSERDNALNEKGLQQSNKDNRL